MKKRNNEAQDMLAMAQAAATMGLGSQQSPGLDLNKIMMADMAMRQPPAEAVYPLLQAYGDDPQKLASIFPWAEGLAKQAADPNGPPMGKELMELLQGSGTKLKERRPVTGNQGAAEAMVDESGNILGFAQPGSTDLLKDYVPDAESVGGFPAFKYQLADWLKQSMNWSRPQFKQPAVPAF